MADNKNEAAKPSYFKQVKAEFKKISWPEKTDLIKQSVAVLCTSVVVGIIIAIIDAAVKYGVNNFLVK